MSVSIVGVYIGSKSILTTSKPSFLPALPADPVPLKISNIFIFFLIGDATAPPSTIFFALNEV